MLFLLSALAFADDAPPPVPTGRIEAVVVYPDRASITRSVDVPVKAGVNEVTFRDLPPTVDERSFTVEGSGVAGSTLLGLDVVSRELAEDRRARVAELQKEIDDANEKIRVDEDAQAAAQVELQFLQQLQAAAAKQVSDELMFADKTPQHVKDVADLLRTRVPEVQKTIRDATFAERDDTARRDALQREMSTVQGAAQWARRDVTVQLQSPQDGTAHVALTYTLPGASWSAAYDARAPGDGKSVDLTLSALVTQTTGEDWTDVKLSLSTARPQGGVTPPELPPFYLQEMYEYPGQGYGSGGGAYYEEDDEAVSEKKGKSAPAAAAPAPPPPPPAVAMSVQQATVSERAIATSFDVPTASTVTGDGTRRKIRVTSVSFDVDYLRVAVPRLDPETVWLVGKATWKESWPLLPGDVASFLDDAYVGTSPVALTGTGGDFELGFGRDDAVSLETKVVSDLTSNPNLLGKVHLTRAWTYTVKNGRKTAVKVEVRDRIPVSTEDKYKVDYTGDPPTEETPDGLVTFDRPVEPGQSTTVAVGYRLRYPRKHPPAEVD